MEFLAVSLSIIAEAGLTPPCLEQVPRPSDVVQEPSLHIDPACAEGATAFTANKAKTALKKKLRTSNPR